MEGSRLIFNIFGHIIFHKTLQRHFCASRYTFRKIFNTNVTFSSLLKFFYQKFHIKYSKKNISTNLIQVIVPKTKLKN